MHQPRLFCFESDFWKDLDSSISFMVRDLILGRDIPRIVQGLRKAGVQRCSESLLYAWANPNKDQLPSLKTFLLIIKICEDCSPIDAINEACGKIAGPEDDHFELIRSVNVEYERRQRMKG